MPCFCPRRAAELACAALLILGLSTPAIAATGRALCIGLDRVDPNNYQGWQGVLRGAENDAQDMMKLLRAANFSVTPLLTPAATHDAVLSEITTAAKSLRAGDLLVITYSGHGGQVPDQTNTEPSGYHSTWCLYDRELLDNELGLAWTQFQEGVHIVVISDSCHSGSVIELLLSTPAASTTLTGLPPQQRNALQTLYLSETLPLRQPPNPVKAIPTSAQQKVLNRDAAYYAGLLKSLPFRDQNRNNTKAAVLLLAACADTEVAFEQSGRGVFTDALTRTWRRAPSFGTYETFLASIRARVLRRKRQTPQLYSLGQNVQVLQQMSPFSY